MIKTLIAVASLAAIVACTPAPEPGANGATDTPSAGAGTNGPGNGDAPAADTGQALLARLEREARALAKAGPCPDGAQCRTAPVGERPCGGPREYLIYCAATTDSAALFGKLDELARAEKDFNTRHELASTCEFRMPPETEIAAGTCRAKPAQ